MKETPATSVILTLTRDEDLHYTRFGRLMADYLGMRSSLIFGKIKYVKDEIVTSTGFTNATPQRKVLFINRVTG